MKEIIRLNRVLTDKGSIDRVEAVFSGIAYAPHRHDTYTLAITTQGVQSFNYRGTLRYSLPGQVVLLHPDEMHDGMAGTERPFGYRGINIDPADVQDILQGGSLPFLNGAVTDDARMVSVAHRMLDEFDRSLNYFEYQDALFDFATALQAVTGKTAAKLLVNYPVIKRAKEYIDDTLDQELTLDSLASVCGYSKWQLSRDFRTLFGTSPYRYLTLRRLQQAKSLIAKGHALSCVAHKCHFADQSHFTRQFKKSFGMTPKRWAQFVNHV